MKLSEELLYFLWKFRLFNHKDLTTTSGETLEIISAGIHNKEAGPDFEHAKVKIGETVWVGNVEMHLRSSDWDNHKHFLDKAYNNVVLHVVWEHDKEILRNDGTRVPTLAIRGLEYENIEARYRDLVENLNWIPCENQLATVEDMRIESWLSRVLIERLEQRSLAVRTLLGEYKGSWDDAFYVMLARNFGFKTNALPFELLARSLPQTILAKHKNNPFQIESLIFGQAGFLSGHLEDDYPMKLKAEYIFLKKKYNLVPLDQYLWKFLRLRPNNFPTVRLAQFSALVFRSSHLFSKIVEVTNVKELWDLFNDLAINIFWRNHYRFGKVAPESSKQLGDNSINNILMNAVVLFIFTYGKETGQREYVSRAIDILQSIPFELNQVTAGFKKIGVKLGNADRSQALMQLKKEYCDERRCLDCGIGAKVINQN